MGRLKKIAAVEDPETGMVLERVDKTMEGERFTAHLVVNPKERFRSFAGYKKMGQVWILFGCPGRENGGRCATALVAQHVLYRSFEKAYPRFMTRELQETWGRHREKLGALSGG
jgi:hypothetical protein